MKKLLFAIASVGVITLGLITQPSAQASAYSAAVMADNPVAYYRMSETSGTTAVDSIAAQNGTYVGGVTLGNAGPQPPAFPGFESSNTGATLDGSTGYLDTGSAITTLSTTAYSMETWFKYTSNGDPRYIVGRYNGASSFGDDVFAVGVLGYFNGTDDPTLGSVLTQGVWHYVALTHNGSAVNVYLDGVLDMTATSTAPYGTSNRIFAGIRGDGAWPFASALDELAVYNTELSAAEVANHYAAAFNIPEPSTVMLLGMGGLLLFRRRSASPSATSSGPSGYGGQGRRVRQPRI